MRSLRWLPAVVLVPLGTSVWLVLIALWLGIWGAANAAIAVRDESLPALGRAVEGAARAAAVASWIASGWGTLSPAFPALKGASEVGQDLRALSAAGLHAAPAIPDALGQRGPRSYLFATLNDAELFASGGAPLNALVVRVDQRDVTIPISGSVSMGINFGNQPYPWAVTGGMPWYRPGAEYPFANANYHPHFPISGRNMVVAWNALGYEQVDGVVTVDVAAVAAVLAAIGPVQSDGYGTVTAENVVRTLLVDAYREYPEWDVEARLARQGANAQLQQDLIDRLREWRTALRAARALWDVIPSRHVQAYMADPELQSAVAAIGADGALSVPRGDVLGVFAQSAPSKLAIFQKQRIERRVEVHPDGSAHVSQRVVFTNAVPQGLSGDGGAHRGYLALRYRQRVAYRIPATATDPALAVEDARALVNPDATGPFPDGSGAEVLWQGQDVPPRLTGATSLAYDLPPGTFGGTAGLRYVLTADPQARVEPATLDVTVVFPTGSKPHGAGSGWAVEGSIAHWSGTLDRETELTVHG